MKFRSELLVSENSPIGANIVEQTVKLLMMVQIRLMQLRLLLLHLLLL